MEIQSENQILLTMSEHENGKEIKPIVYAKFVVSRAKLAFGLGLGFHVFMLFLTGVLAASGYDILALDFSTLPLRLEKDSTKLRTDAWRHVRSDQSITPSSSIMAGQKRRSVLYQPLELVYETKGGNIFTRENLLTIKENEDELFQDTTYQSRLCQLDSSENQTCTLPLSVLRFFDGTYKAISPLFYDPDFNNISSVLTTAKEIASAAAILNYNLGKDVTFDKQNGLVTSQYTRSLMYFGWPLKGYNSTDDREDDQKKTLDNDIPEAFMNQLTKKYENKLGDINFYFFNMALLIKKIQTQVILDMLLAVASFIFIFLFMWLQTGSLWLAGWGIFSILSCFNITNFIYRVIFDYKYIGIFHVLSIFIILGIGSDNIFVFMDTWKASAWAGHKTLENRLSVVYKSAAKATFVTSLTTTIAFLCNVQSPLLCVSSFGLFSAILVTINYFSSILFYPTVIILHELFRQGRCCWFPLGRQTVETPEVLELTENNEQPERDADGDRGGNFVIRFLEGWFYENVVTHRIVRWIVLFFFFVLVTVCLVFATQLQPKEEQLEILGPQSNWGKIGKLRRTAFSASREVVVVHIIWGLKEQDRSMCHHTDFKCKGKTVFDKSFDLNPPPCQNAVLQLCKKFQNLSKAQEHDLRLRRDKATGEVEIQCMFERMDEWLEVESNKTKYPAGSDFALPVTAQKIRPLMKANPSIYNVSILPETYYRYFEVALGFFLFDGRSPRYANSYDFRVYSKLVGGALDEGISGDYKNVLQGNKYGNRLMFVAIALNTTLSPLNLAFSDGLSVYDDWENFVNDQMKEMPSSCNNAFQATVGLWNIWHWLKIQKILVTSAITGILIGLLSSCVVLILATTNVIVGGLASLTICLITCCVLGMIKIIGWKLGVLESLNLTLVVGLAVDYVVHLAEGYMELHGENRLARVRHTLRHVGISVLSGACTTLGASIFMLAAKIIFFFQFGIFMFCTIGFSILFSLLFFTTALALVGPQEDEKGSIIPAVQHARGYLRGKRKGDVDCSTCEGKGFIRQS